MIVNKVVTTPTREQFAEALAEEWNCSLLTGSILFAQFAFETGWGKYCYCWNLGNVRADSEWIKKGNDYFELPGAWEIINGKKVIAGGFFRAHKSLNDGISSHINFLEMNSRYSQAFDVLQETRSIYFSKDAAKEYSIKFAIALKRGGYYTGSLEEYSKGIASIASGLKIVEENKINVLDHKEEISPNEWGPITVCEAFERIGLTSICSVER